MFSNISSKHCIPLFRDILDRTHVNIEEKTEILEALNLYLSKNDCQ